MEENKNSIENKEEQVRNKNITIYCHFSFKRPKGKEHGLFAVAFYSDFDGKKLITSKTRKYDLWKNHQFVTAVQSYEHALLTIYEYQGMMREAGVRQVMLVTNNSTLAGWIEQPSKNKDYEKYMKKAVKIFMVGGPKEIALGVGLCEPRDAEKSYKYCKEERVVNTYIPKEEREKPANGYKLKVEGYKSALDIMNENISMPEIDGIEEVKVN